MITPPRASRRGSRTTATWCNPRSTPRRRPNSLESPAISRGTFEYVRGRSEKVRSGRERIRPEMEPRELLAEEGRSMSVSKRLLAVMSALVGAILVLAGCAGGGGGASSTSGGTLILRIIGIEPGAIISTKIEEHVIPDYNLTLEHEPSSTAAMLAEVERLYADKEE